jgi:hypothetical protein
MNLATQAVQALCLHLIPHARAEAPTKAAELVGEGREEIDDEGFAGVNGMGGGPPCA